MAAELNKTRIRDSRLVALLCIIIYFFTKPMAAADSGFRMFLDFIGYGLIVLCAVGRIYTTAFLGGNKNVNLMTEGPFSRVRNPLYFFSFVGVLGVSFLTARLGIILIAPIATAIIYHYLVKREEAFLQEKFGAPYVEYMAKVPRFIPNLKLASTPETITTTPKLLYAAVLDSAWWFLMVPFFAFMQAIGK